MGEGELRWWLLKTESRGWKRRWGLGSKFYRWVGLWYKEGEWGMLR